MMEVRICVSRMKNKFSLITDGAMLCQWFFKLLINILNYLLHRQTD